MHGGLDGVVGPATTQVGHCRRDLCVGRMGRVLEQGGGCHDLSGLAIAALGDLMLYPGGDHPFAHRIGFDGFYGGDIAPDDARNGGDAGAQHVAVDHHRARAALCQAAAVFGPGQPQVVPDDPQQWCVRVGIDLVGLLVDSKLHGSPAISRLVSRFSRGSNTLGARHPKTLAQGRPGDARRVLL